MSVAIHARDLTIVRNGVSILTGIDFSVGHGERVIVAGENGAGKTTLLKAALGLVPLTAGTLSVLGSVVGSRQWKIRRRAVGYVNQESVQVDFPISAQEVVEIGLALQPRAGRRSRALAAMEQTGTATLAQRDYRVLSGGEKQRVSIARCLAQDAAVLLLDEPGAFLDSKARHDVISILEQLNRDSALTVVLVTHQPDEIESEGWRILTLSGGVIEEAS